MPAVPAIFIKLKSTRYVHFYTLPGEILRGRLSTSKPCPKSLPILPPERLSVLKFFKFIVRCISVSFDKPVAHLESYSGVLYGGSSGNGFGFPSEMRDLDLMTGCRGPACRRPANHLAPVTNLKECNRTLELFCLG